MQLRIKINLILMVAVFLTACTDPAVEKPEQVRIIRDNYGVPHIYADSRYGLYYGYGYAIAQDRLFQMEMARRSTQGTVAEVLGADYIDYDSETRRLFDPASIHKQLAGLNKEDLDIFEGYAAGINAWLTMIRNNPDELTPKQFLDRSFSPSDWMAYDVAMIFIGTMNNRFGDINSEMENAAIYNALIRQHGQEGGRRIFDLLNPRFTHDAPTTIPGSDWSKQVDDNLANAAFSQVRIADAFKPGAVISGFSNCYILGKEKVSGANSILVNGPQFGWFNPSYVYSVGLHGAGVDVVGNTPFGYPVILFGHNKNISWGSTWGVSDIVDIYMEELSSNNPEQYLFEGHYRDMSHKKEVIKVKGSEDIVIDVYRTVHGPVTHIDPESGVAYAKRRAWEGRELENLLAWMGSTWADDFDSWKNHIQEMSINVNAYYADVEGNIGYFHGGRFPVRAPGHDNRLPVTGDGSKEWQGRQPIEHYNPHILNPEGDYIANWNNKPGQGVLNPDFYFSSWSEADRVDVLHELLADKDSFTPEEAWSVIETSSHADVNAAYFLPIIKASITAVNDPVFDEVNAVFKAWNSQSRDLDGDGFYDQAATAIFRTFLDNLIIKVLEDDLGDAFPYFAYSGYPTSDKPTGSGTNNQSGVKTILATLKGETDYDFLNGIPAEEMIRIVLKDSITTLVDAQKVSIPELRLAVAPRPYASRNFLGIPQAGEDEALITPEEQNRGTENNMIVMKPGAIVAWEVTPPGQNAFISPQGEKSAHYDDQLDMYYQFGKKRVWFYQSDVEANRQTETVLSLDG